MSEIANFPAYGDIPWADLVKAVGEVRGSPWEPSDALYIGHQHTFLNMNSINRIVSYFVARETTRLREENDKLKADARASEAMLLAYDRVIANLREENARQAAALREASGCFAAAYAEGLAERLSEAPDGIGSLRDLVCRRILHAAEAIDAALHRSPPMKDASEIARSFVAEQSGGEWGEKLEFTDALRLSGVIRAAQAEAYAEGLRDAEAAVKSATRAPAQRNAKDLWVESIGDQAAAAIRALASEKEGAQ